MSKDIVVFVFPITKILNEAIKKGMVHLTLLEISLEFKVGGADNSGVVARFNIWLQ